MELFRVDGLLLALGEAALFLEKERWLLPLDRPDQEVLRELSSWDDRPPLGTGLLGELSRPSASGEPLQGKRSESTATAQRSFEQEAYDGSFPSGSGGMASSSSSWWLSELAA
jgi:hypothetical protein